MGYRRDLTGQKFGKLTVVSFSHNDKGGRAFWLFKCDCGNEKTIAGYHVANGAVVSCGCHRKMLNYKHGGNMNGKRTQDYMMWQNMIARCNRKTHPEYPRYGGRGIKVFDEWQKDFILFCEYIGARPSEKYEIDRIDNNGNYEPGNVRWATKSVNTQNRRVISKTGFKGVGKQKLTGRWFARISVLGKPIYLGTYDTIEDAASAYDVAAIKYYGEKVVTNFPVYEYLNVCHQ